MFALEYICAVLWPIRSWTCTFQIYEKRTFVMAILHWKQGVLCDKTIYLIIILFIFLFIRQLIRLTRKFEKQIFIRWGITRVNVSKNWYKKYKKLMLKGSLILSQTSHGFYVSAVQIFWKQCGKRRNCSLWARYTHVFYPLGKLSDIFIRFESVVCKLFQFGQV